MSDQSTLNSGTADPDIVLILSFYVFCVQIYLTIGYFRRACGLTCNCTDTYLLFSFTSNCYGGSCQTQILHRHRILQHGKQTGTFSACGRAICSCYIHTIFYIQVIDCHAFVAGKALQVLVGNRSERLVSITAVPGSGVIRFFLFLLFKMDRIAKLSCFYIFCHSRFMIQILQMAAIINSRIFRSTLVSKKTVGVILCKQTIDLVVFTSYRNFYIESSSGS